MEKKKEKIKKIMNIIRDYYKKKSLRILLYFNSLDKSHIFQEFCCFFDPNDIITDERNKGVFITHVINSYEFFRKEKNYLKFKQKYNSLSPFYMKWKDVITKELEYNIFQTNLKINNIGLYDIDNWKIGNIKKKSGAKKQKRRRVQNTIQYRIQLIKNIYCFKWGFNIKSDTINLLAIDFDEINEMFFKQEEKLIYQLLVQINQNNIIKISDICVNNKNDCFAYWDDEKKLENNEDFDEEINRIAHGCEGEIDYNLMKKYRNTKLNLDIQEYKNE
ncbi:hypothetical protein K9M42_02975 [Patescibacteria group bacterium]|nr:hypothetical protein [Patescibacteria group bacterium]